MTLNLAQRKMLKLTSTLTLLSMLWICCISPTSAGGLLPGKDHNEVAVDHFMWRMTMDVCYGKQFMANKELSMRNLLSKCFINPLAYQDNKNDEEAAQITESPSSTTAANIEKRSVTDPTMETVENAGAEEQIKKKRPAFLDVDTVRQLTKNVMQTVGVASCFMDAMNLSVNANDTVEGESFTQKYLEDPRLSAEMKPFLGERFQTCDTHSNEGDFMMWGQEFADFHKMLKYYRCIEWQFLYACMNFHFTTEAHEFGLAGLDGKLSDVDDVTKMKFIFSSFSNWDNTGIWDS